jgi:hypothetical protein
LIEDPEGAMSKLLSHKYLGQDPPDDAPGVVRLVVRVTPAKIVEFLA